VVVAVPREGDFIVPFSMPELTLTARTAYNYLNCLNFVDMPLNTNQSVSHSNECERSERCRNHFNYTYIRVSSLNLRQLERCSTDKALAATCSKLACCGIWNVDLYHTFRGYEACGPNIQPTTADYITICYTYSYCQRFLVLIGCSRYVYYIMSVVEPASETGCWDWLCHWKSHIRFLSVTSLVTALIMSISFIVYTQILSKIKPISPRADKEQLAKKGVIWLFRYLDNKYFHDLTQFKVHTNVLTNPGSQRPVFSGSHPSNYYAIGLLTEIDVPCNVM